MNEQRFGQLDRCFQINFKTQKTIDNG